MNTVGHATKNAQIRVVTGKTLTCGGSRGREKATAQGLVYCIIEWAKREGFELEGKSAVRPGLRQRRLARVAAAQQARRVDRRGRRSLRLPLQPRGLQPAQARRVRAAQRLDRRLQRRAGDRARGLLRDRERPLHPRRASRTRSAPKRRARSRSRLVAEGANGPVNPDGEAVLAERGIEVIPDVLANSGGVTVSYFEWVQNKRSETWDLEEVDAKLERKMKPQLPPRRWASRARSRCRRASRPTRSRSRTSRPPTRSAASSPDRRSRPHEPSPALSLLEARAFSSVGCLEPASTNTTGPLIAGFPPLEARAFSCVLRAQERRGGGRSGRSGAPWTTPRSRARELDAVRQGRSPAGRSLHCDPL